MEKDKGNKINQFIQEINFNGEIGESDIFPIVVFNLILIEIFMTDSVWFNQYLAKIPTTTQAIPEWLSVSFVNQSLHLQNQGKISSTKELYQTAQTMIGYDCVEFKKSLQEYSEAIKQKTSGELTFKPIKTS